MSSDKAADIKKRERIAPTAVEPSTKKQNCGALIEGGPTQGQRTEATLLGAVAQAASTGGYDDKLKTMTRDVPTRSNIFNTPRRTTLLEEGTFYFLTFWHDQHTS